MNVQEELKELTLRISRGDERAFKQFFDHYFNMLVNYAYGFVLDRSIAEDIVLELMVSIWSMGKKITTIQNIKSYLYRATKNRALNQIKQNEKFSFEELEDISLDSVTPESQLITKEKTEFIQHAIDSLPLRCRTVFIMIRDNKMSYQEVADILEISVNTVNRHMQDALNRLYNQLMK